MSYRTIIRLVSSIAGAAIIAGAQLIAPAASAAPASTLAPVVLYYDASRTEEFVDAVHKGADNWNASVVNVRLERVPQGRRANITVYADDGWPRAYVRSLGNGTFVMGRDAVDIGHYPPRIAAHELGHLLGLPDRRTGLCSDLMSGSSAPASCKNDLPSAKEKADVERNFRPRTTALPLAVTTQAYVCVY